MIGEQVLRNIPLLSKLDAGELQKLSCCMRERRASKGSYLIYAEEKGPSILFLAEGAAKVTLVSSDGKEIALYHLSEGDFFGEISVITGEERSANVVALTDCRVFILHAEDFNAHVKENNGLALAMMKELALRLRAATAKIGDLALFDVYRRVARTLKSIATTENTAQGAKLIVHNRPTHQELANMTGTSREMVTRALHELEDAGSIVIEGKSIIINDVPT